MNNVLKDKINQLTNKCQILQKHVIFYKQGKYLQCIQIMKEIVTIKKNFFGINHHQVIFIKQFEKAQEKLCQYLNFSAMILLQKQKFDLSLDFLKNAQLVANHSQQFKSTTFNNLACYYRKTGKFKTVLAYLIQALEIQLKLNKTQTLADTHLNICAVLSQLDKHQEALQHVMLSVILLQDQFLQVTFKRAKQQQKDILNNQRMTVLAIAYHNLGVQFEHMKRQALKLFQKALNFSKTHLSNNQQLINNLSKVVLSANENIQQNKNKFTSMRKTRNYKDLKQNKKDLYKDLKELKLNNLPKLKFDKTTYQINQQSKNNLILNSGNNSKKYSHHKNQPIVFKSFAISPTAFQRYQSLQSKQSNSRNFGIISNHLTQRPLLIQNQQIPNDPYR